MLCLALGTEVEQGTGAEQKQQDIAKRHQGQQVVVALGSVDIRAGRVGVADDILVRLLSVLDARHDGREQSKTDHNHDDGRDNEIRHCRLGHPSVYRQWGI